MLLSTVLFCAALALLALTVGLALRWRSDDRLERAFAVVSPLPVICTIAMPALIGLTMGYRGPATAWIQRLSWVGLGASAVLTAIGLALIVRAAMRRQHRTALLAIVVLAAGPVLIVVASYFLWAVAAALT